MRWSLVCLTTILAASSVLEGILCAPIDTVELEARGPVKTKKVVDKNKLTSTTFKKSSSTYRKAALKSPYTFAVQAGKVAKLKTSAKRAKNRDADHIFEGQTLKKALQDGGHTTKSGLGKKALTATKGVLNDPQNMAYLDKDVNIRKGQLHKSALAGGNPTIDPHVKDYMQQTADRGKNTAKALDDALKKHGITGVDVQGTHKGVLDAAGVKRREYILDELD